MKYLGITKYLYAKCLTEQRGRYDLDPSPRTTFFSSKPEDGKRPTSLSNRKPLTSPRCGRQMTRTHHKQQSRVHQQGWTPS